MKVITKRFGDLKEGDRILSPDGTVSVVAGYDEHVPETMYEVETDSGAVVKASGNHLWYIETSLDIQAHRERRRAGRRALANLSANTLRNLEKIAEYDDDLTTSLMDIVEMLNVEGDGKAESALFRIAESIGPVAEDNLRFQNFDNVVEDETVSTTREYDARRFSQQILSLTGLRKYRKKYPLVVGRVVSTEEMIELSRNFEVFIPDPE